MRDGSEYTGGPAHILHVFHGFGVGGSEVRTCQIINALGGAYRHTVVSLSGDFGARSLLTDPVNVRFLHPPRFFERSFFSNALAARGWLKNTRPDLMIAYAWGAFEWVVGNTVRKICPDIYSIEGFNADEAARENRRRRLLRRVFLPRCTALHACSQNLRDAAVRSWSVDSDRVAYVPNGIDVGLFSPERSDASAIGAPVRLGIVASLTPVKNHALLVDAFRRLPSGSASLSIVGDGPERDTLAATLQEEALGGRVTLVGHQRDPATLLRQFDIFCLSSKSEQMPIAVLEAMACGLPVVSTDVGDVRHMVCDENKAFIVPVGDAAAYHNALEVLIRDAALRTRIGRRNRRRCEESFNITDMVRRHQALYDRCIRRVTRLAVEVDSSNAVDHIGESP